jgi:hypothetical protein
MNKEFWKETLTERRCYEDKNVDERITLRWILEKWDGIMDEIYLAQDRPMVGFVNTVMNLSVPLNAENIMSNRPWRPIGLRDVEAPTLSRQLAHRWRCIVHSIA